MVADGRRPCPGPGARAARGRLAGAWTDRLAVAAGAPKDPRIVPFRGAYLRLCRQRAHLVRGNIYAVPDPELPFLAPHLTRTIDGDVLLGPTAPIVAARDAYRATRVIGRDLRETFTWPGTWRLAGRHWRAGLTEIRHASSRRASVAAAKRLVPELKRADFVPGLAGIRARRRIATACSSTTSSSRRRSGAVRPQRALAGGHVVAAAGPPDRRRGRADPRRRKWERGMTRGVTPDDVRELALALPEVEEGRSWEMPSFKVRKRALAFLREDGETLSLKVDLLEREALVADPSGAFFITPHYEKYPYVVVRLDAGRARGAARAPDRGLAPRSTEAPRRRPRGRAPRRGLTLAVSLPGRRHASSNVPVCPYRGNEGCSPESRHEKTPQTRVKPSRTSARPHNTNPRPATSFTANLQRRRPHECRAARIESPTSPPRRAP